MEPEVKCDRCGSNKYFSGGEAIGLERIGEPCATIGCNGSMVPVEKPADTKPAVEDFTGTVTGGGYKASMDDPKKVPLSLIDPEYLLGTGRVLQHGAKKYAPGNWMRGMSWQEVLSALQRHTLAVQNGEDRDPETGELHAYHISCCAMFLARFMSREEYKQFDDRLFKPVAAVSA